MFTHYAVKPGSPTWLWILAVLGDFLLFGGILFALLSFVPARFRKILIAACTFLAGLVYSVEYFVPGNKQDMNFLTGLTQQLDQALTVVYTFVLGIGVYSLMRFHANSLARKRQSWPYNLTFFLAFFGIIILGFWKDASSSKAVLNAYDMLYNSTVVAFGATMFSMIGFYIISAAYRAFRIRSGEATLMLTAALIVMLGQVSIGAYLTHWLPETGWLSFFRLENLSYWILRAPNMAAQRGMSFGIEVGALAMALRIWLSLERGSFFEQEL